VDSGLLNVFARVFLVASRLSIVRLSAFNISQKVWNGFWRNFQRRSAIIKYAIVGYSYTMQFANRLPFSQHLVQRYSESPAVNLGTAKILSPKLCTKFPPLDTPKIKDDWRSSWKRLRSSPGLALDDDDDDANKAMRAWEMMKQLVTVSNIQTAVIARLSHCRYRIKRIISFCWTAQPYGGFI